VTNDDAQVRIDELEFRFTHQEKLLEQLNEVVIEQRSVILRLEIQIGALRDQLGGMSSSEGGEDPPPPHY